MIIIDTALAKRHADNNPVRVAMVGAGFMAKGIALQIFQSVPGMELVAVANRTADNARKLYAEAGQPDVAEVHTVSELEQNIKEGKYSITTDYNLVCKAQGIDAVVEVTGALEFGATVALAAIQGGKHIIMMDAEVDGTVGCILKVYADKAGVVYTNVDGDQPGVIMNLFRFAGKNGS